VQPLWVESDNATDEPARLVLASIDESYFPPFEIAWMKRRAVRKQDRSSLERWLYENRMPRLIPARESRAGFVFTHSTPGTKAFSADVLVGEQLSTATFLLPTAGFQPDYLSVDAGSLYADEQIESLDLERLRAAIEAAACCGTAEPAQGVDLPLNVVFVATPMDLLRLLLRTDWIETEAGDATTITAAAPRYRGRPPDGTFYRTRSDGDERSELRIWLSPLRFGDTPVWFADLSASTSGRAAEDVGRDDVAARLSMFQEFLYSQYVARFGFALGAADAVGDGDAAPVPNDGRRLVLFVSPVPRALDDVEWLGWGASPQ
jgi:hypothetical protein